MRPRHYSSELVFQANRYRRFGCIAATAVLISVVPSQTFADVKPGAIPAHFAVGDQGDARYSIPIMAPAATGGLRPNVALSYNHLADNGLAGMRWTLSGLSAITRCGQTYAQDGQSITVGYGAADKFCLDGQRLVEYAGSYGASGTEYRTEIETFQRIYQSGTVGGGPQQFYVQHGDGRTSYYGYTTDSRIEKVGSSAVRKWQISFTEDQFGNRINYVYDENSSTGEVVPTEINWTSNTGQVLSPRYKIMVSYENRPSDDQRTGFESGGAQVATTKRIDKIEVIHDGSTTISTYDLSYTTPTSTGTGRSQLESVMLCRSTDCLPATQFALQDGIRGWNGLTGTGMPSYSSTQVGDFNNDGKQDLFVNAGTWKVYPGNANGLLDSAIDSGAGGPNPGTARVLDYNGDGRADLLYQASTNLWEVLTANANGTGFDGSVSTGVPNWLVDNAEIRDFDGDGLGDWLYWEGNTLKWRRNNGNGGTSGFESEAALIAVPESNGYYGRTSFIPNASPPDYNGDGRADFVAAEYQLTCPFPDFCYETYTFNFHVASGSGYSPYDSLQVVNETIFNFKAIDINGDRLTDLLYQKYVNEIPKWYTQLNTGTGFAGEVDTNISGVDAHLAFVADYDNDGRGDLIRPVGDYLLIHRSNGATISSTVAESLSSTGASSTGGFAADLSGDGFPEVVRSQSSSWLTHKHKSVLPDVVTSFTNGLGHGIDVGYESLSNHTYYTVNAGQTPPAPYIRKFSGPRYVVTSDEHDDGIGGTRTITHKYDTAYVDIAGRGWHSFAWHVAEDAAQGVNSATWFNQTWPYAGIAELFRLRRTSDNQTIREVDPSLLATTWTSTTPDRHFVRAEQTTTMEYEVDGVADGQHLRTIVDDPTFETSNYGHITSRTITTQDPVTAETWTSATTFDASADTDDWCLAQPGLVETTNTLPDLTSSTRKVRHTWNLDNCSLTETTDESESDPAKRLRTTYTYDGYGNPNLVSQDSADGSAQNRSTDLDFDSFGQLPTSVTVGTVNLTTSFTWDYLTGQRASVTGTDGLTTSWLHDAFGRVTQETRPDGSTTVTRTACSGACWPQNAVFYAHAQGSDGSDDYAYFDELGRSVGREWTLPGGTQGREETRYTGTGQVDRLSRPYLSGDPVYWVTYVYDTIGRAAQENAPIDELYTSGSLTTTEYRGHDLWVTDAEGGTTKYTHNAARQIKQVLDALNGSTTYAYGPFGELKTVTDHQGNVTTIGYDSRGFKTSLNDPDLGVWNYAHNVYGELVSETDPKTYPNPTRTYSYDPAGRIGQRVEPEGTTTWTYYSSGAGAIGKPYTVSGPSNSEYYEYSTSFGAPTLVRRVIDGATYETNYAYHTSGNGQGKLSRITYPTGSLGTRLKADYSYDSFGYLDQVYNGDAPSLVWYTLSSADALGRERAVIFGNGVNEVRSYDRANLALQSIASGPTGTPTSVQNLAYQWDKVGNLEQRQDFIPGKTEGFVYDALSRLRTVQLNAGTVLSVDYDAIGNISYKSDVGTYTYGAGSAGPHAVTSVSGIQSNTYQYDANGNMNNKDGEAITWYSFNKPLQINYGAASSQMVYGVHRQRIKQSAVGYSAGTLYYVGPEFELLTQGPLRADLHYIFANGRAIARYTTYNFQGPDTRYLHRDSLGSIVATSSATGSVLSRYEFDAFGVRWQTAGSGLFTQKGFTGHEHLDAVDLIDMVGRVQDPVLGRFLSADPLVQAPYHSQSLNRYSYAWNNPATLVDPSGFCNVTVTTDAPVFSSAQSHPATSSDSPSGGIQSASITNECNYPILWPSANGGWTLPSTVGAPMDFVPQGGQPQGQASSNDRGVGAFGSKCLVGTGPSCWTEFDEGLDNASLGGLLPTAAIGKLIAGQIAKRTAARESVWIRSALQRGIDIEDAVAASDYAGWFRVGQLNNGKFPLVDFQRGNNLVSLKSVDTTGATWMGRMREHISALSTSGATVNGSPANMILDLRVQPGGSAAAADLIQFGRQNGVTVIVKEFP